MNSAVERTYQSILNGDLVGIFGDYDVDGATSTAILSKYFLSINQKVHTYIPDRQTEGYGPTINAFNKIGCHAFSPGSKDFAAGLNFLKEMQMKANFPFISANIQDKNGNRLFDPYLITDMNGISIGIIGLASQFTHSEIYVKNKKYI